MTGVRKAQGGLEGISQVIESFFERFVESSRCQRDEGRGPALHGSSTRSSDENGGLSLQPQLQCAGLKFFVCGFSQRCMGGWCGAPLWLVRSTSGVKGGDAPFHGRCLRGDHPLFLQNRHWLTCSTCAVFHHSE